MMSGSLEVSKMMLRCLAAMVHDARLLEANYNNQRYHDLQINFHFGQKINLS
jgi:hypothetical protein